MYSAPLAWSYSLKFSEDTGKRCSVCDSYLLCYTLQRLFHKQKFFCFFDTNMRKIIRKLNNELSDKGYITVSGKVNRIYFEEKIYAGCSEKGGVS